MSKMEHEMQKLLPELVAEQLERLLAQRSPATPVAHLTNDLQRL
jgi:hypothetical protein